jgi:hypothetical protein
MVAAIVMAVLAAGLAGALIALLRSRAAERRVHTAALADALRARDDLHGEHERLRAEHDGFVIELDHHRRRGEELARELAAATDAAEAARREAAAAAAGAAIAGEELASLRQRVADQAAAGHDAEALWSLELARTARRWYHSVSPGPDAPCPLVDTSNALRTAIEIEAAALREEAGARIEVHWDLQESLPPEQSLLVLRVAQELLADAVTLAEITELTVAADGRTVVVTRRGFDEDDAIVGAPSLLLPAGRAVVSGDVVTIS